MPAVYSLREMTANDSAALAELTAQSPDGGRITFNPTYHVPAYTAYAARHGDLVGVVAEVPGKPGLIGAAHASFGECQFEGDVRPYALLSSLMVHPDYRRQGIASALAEWRIDRATKRSRDTLIIADIQTGNAGSTANAKKWATQIGGKFVTSPVGMRSQPPRPAEGITIREAAPGELDEIAANLNTFYAGYNFFRPQTGDHLRSWLQNSPLSTPVHHYWVAADRTNRPVAGIGISEEGRLMSTRIVDAPALIRVANLFLKVIPPDNEMRNLQVEKLWYSPGQLEAARFLYQTIRWEWRDRGSSLVVNYDPRGPIRQVTQTPPYMPTTSIRLAIHAPAPMSESRLIDPIL